VKKLVSILFTFTLSLSLSAQTFFSETGTAKFSSRVPLHSFTGSSKNLVGLIKLDEMLLDFYIDLETLKTGNAKRDKDMLVTLNTEEYPFGEFFGKIISDFDPTNSEEQYVKVSGEFTIHGKTKEVEIDGTLTIINNVLIVKASWVLNLNDYDIKPPKFLILKVHEDQFIEIETTLKPYQRN